MPPLIRFLLKWSAIGVLAGWAFLALLIVFDVGGLTARLIHSSSAGIALLILALSFAVSFSQITVLAAVLLRKDFGGTAGNARLDAWKAGRSAELSGDDDRPL